MAQKTIYDVEQIGAIITYMKAQKNITDITENAGISTITTNTLVLLTSFKVFYLAVGQIVTINSINYPVLSVNSKNKTFTIAGTGLYHMSTDPIPVKVLDATKWNLAINYLYGSRQEINEILVNASKDPAQKLIRFPLIWLFVNNDKKMNTWDNIDFDTNLKFAIVHLTKKEYKADDRLTYVFKPVLQPLWELFLATMTSPYFTYMLHFETFDFKYDKYDRYFYGSSDKNAMVLDSATDAIEISIDLQFKKQYS